MKLKKGSLLGNVLGIAMIAGFGITYLEGLREIDWYNEEILTFFVLRNYINRWACKK